MGLLVAVAIATFVDVTEPGLNGWSQAPEIAAPERSNATLRHQAALHHAHQRLNSSFEDGVENARAADLAIQNLDCWENELKSKGETEKADACRQGFESALAAISTTKLSQHASLGASAP